MNDALLSTGTDYWETPSALFAELHREFGFTLDAAASDNNHKLPRYYTEQTDGLSKSWEGEVVFVNPPYSRRTRTNPGQAAWVEKAYQESQRGATVVLLLPARTDTAAFHDLILPYAEVRFLRGRLKFELAGVPRESAPFPSMLAIFRPREEAGA